MRTVVKERTWPSFIQRVSLAYLKKIKIQQVSSAGAQVNTEHRYESDINRPHSVTWPPDEQMADECLLFSSVSPASPVSVFIVDQVKKKKKHVKFTRPSRSIPRFNGFLRKKTKQIPPRYKSRGTLTLGVIWRFNLVSRPRVSYEFSNAENIFDSSYSRALSNVWRIKRTNIHQKTKNRSVFI